MGRESDLSGAVVLKFSHQYLSGMLLGALAYFGYTTSDAILKFIMGGQNVLAIVALACACNVVLTTTLTCLSGNKAMLKTHYPKRQALRALLAGGAVVCILYALPQVPLASFYLIVCFAPLVVTLAAWGFYAERPTRRIVLALALGLLGAVIVLRPEALPLTLPVFIGSLWLIGNASSIMLARSMPQDAPPIFSITTFSATFLMLLPFVADDLLVTWQAGWPFILAAGACGAFAAQCYYMAYKSTPSAYVAPFQYTQLLWGALYGWLFFAEVPSLYLFIGAVPIIAAGLLVITAPQTRKPA